MITIIPEGEDKFKAVLSKDCEGWFIIAHAGKRFIQVLPPGMAHPITITTQIKKIKEIPRYENDWLTNPIELRRARFMTLQKSDEIEFTEEEIEDIKSCVISVIDEGVTTPPYQDVFYDLIEKLGITQKEVAGYDISRPTEQMQSSEKTADEVNEK